MTKCPRVLVVADTPGWAWERKSLAYVRYLGDRYEVVVCYQTAGLPALDGFDLVHTFEFPQVRFIPLAYRAGGGRVVTGLTANVWRTWGRERVLEWARQADALHANSLLLVRDLCEFVLDPDVDPPLVYCPNGVDPDFWWVAGGAWPDALVAGHVGKPNPRKGAEMIVNACRAVGVPLRLVQRTAKLALSAEAMRDWYQGVSLQVTASDMDGTPNPMLEAAAAGRALLSTPIGNMPQFILPFENGILVQREQSALEDALTWCRDHYDQVLGMGLAARRTVLDGWTWVRQVEHVDRLWRRALEL